MGPRGAGAPRFRLACARGPVIGSALRPFDFLAPIGYYCEPEASGGAAGLCAVFSWCLVLGRMLLDHIGLCVCVVRVSPSVSCPHWVTVGTQQTTYRLQHEWWRKVWTVPQRPSAGVH